ncbi:MAG: DTW domain-containing protein [Oligoflexia bacterium]|nr:DTW domain-containing protein [Oligoflexia bacterium]
MVEKSRQSEELSLAKKVDVQELDNTIKVIVLQHPQEPDKVLGSAPLIIRALKKSDLRIGLSWRSLKSVAGEEAIPSEWAVVYLGSKKDSVSVKSTISYLSKKGEPIDAPMNLKGVILLDGTWSQAKTLWWRNAWLTKLVRICIHPDRPSLYGKLRKEPRREAVSSVEAIAYVLRELDTSGESLYSSLNQAFERMLNLYKEASKNQ